MEYIYVCVFSTGDIKVGRAIHPKLRIRQHQERLSCVGISLVDSMAYQCAGSAHTAESALIDYCTKSAQKHHKGEWFSGLNFKFVCDVAFAVASKPHELKEQTNNIESSPDFRFIVRRLMAIGITQKLIADHLMCDQSTVSDLANGRVTDPRYSVAIKLLAFFHSKAA